jgi:hypothetical protein
MDAQAMLAAIIESSDYAIIGFDLDGVVLSWNAGAEKLYGYERDEIVGKSLSIIVPPERREETERNLQIVRSGGHIHDYPTTRMAKDGRAIPISLCVSPIKDGKGEIIGASAISRDISDRVRAEREEARACAEAERRAHEAEESLGFLEAMMEYVPEAITIVEGPELRVRMRSRHGWEMTGTPPESLLGVSLVEHPELWELLDKDGITRCPMEKVPLYWAVNHGTITLGAERLIRRPEGTSVPVLVNAAPIRDSHGHIIGGIASWSDITARKRMEDNLRVLNEDLDQRVRERTSQLEAFNYSVSHDLRAPLRIIDGFSLALLEDYESRLDEQGRKYLNFVRESAQRMGRLIDDILRLSRVDRAEIQPEDVDLSGLASSIIEELKAGEPERVVAISIERGLTATGDHELLKLMLENLIGNAWKYTAKQSDGRITISSVDRGAEKVFVVVDNGAGFDMTYVDKLFAPFQRLHTDAEFAGNGIGLSIVRRIISSHGGRVWAEGAVGQGASFFFTIPDKRRTK